MPSSASPHGTAVQQEGRWGDFARTMALAEFAPDGRLVFANASFLALLDLGPEHQGNLEHARLCPPELVRSPDYAAMWRSLCTGHEFSGVVERVRGDGGRCWLEALYAPVRDHEGKVSRIRWWPPTSGTASVRSWPGRTTCGACPWWPTTPMPRS